MLKAAPQRHRDTEKNNISISCRASSVHLFGECADGRNNSFSVFSVPLWFNCFF
jgi:hypothetical protein